jgi:outer membrane protein assembly factor BamD (BamD/ComL family)
MAKQKQSSVHEAISASLFEVAKTLDEQRKVHQALAAYLKLIEHYPDSQEVTVATERVLAIADEFRKKGQYYVAMRVFDRLEAAHQGR